MIVSAVFISALLIVNVMFIVTRHMHLYNARCKHIDSLYLVKDALKRGPAEAHRVLNDEIRKA